MMKNIKIYEVQELSFSQMEEIDGGFVFLTGMAIFMAITIVAGPILAWQSGHTVVGQPNGAS